jgi:hypothetical protein
MIRAAYRIVETVKGLQMADISGKSLGLHLKMLDEAKSLLGAFRDALGEKALIDIRNAKPVDGWTWANTETRVRWTSPLDEVYAVGDLYGVDLRVKDAPTPKQAIAKGIPEKIIKTLSASSVAGVKLVPADMKVSTKLFKPQE